MAHQGNNFRGRGGPHQNGGRVGNSGRLPEIMGRFDRYCVWCSGVIVDCALERLGRCNNNRCFRAVPLALGGRRRQDGLHRCARCYSLSHRSFLYCELCGRARTAAEVYGTQLNLEGVDMAIVDPVDAAPVQLPVALNPVGAAAAGAVKQPAVNPAVAAIQPPAAAVHLPPIAAAAVAAGNDEWGDDGEGGDFLGNID